MIIVQTLLQIILESLPISSSGHLALFQKIMGWEELPTSFEYVLHGPTIIVLMVYFRTTWVSLMKHSWRFRYLIAHMIFLAAMADVVTALVYGCMKLVSPQFPLWLGFFITACMLFSLRGLDYKKKRVTYKKALILGFVQGIAGLPGISRLACTYVTGVWLGLSPRKSFYFSCMIQFPLICAGFLYGLWNVQGTAYTEFFWQSYFVITLIGGACVAYALLWWVQRCMQTDNLWKFGCYMLVPLCLAMLFY